MRPDVSKLSKKKMRRMNRLTVAELKQVAPWPRPSHTPGLIKEMASCFSLNCYSSILLSEIAL